MNQNQQTQRVIAYLCPKCTYSIYGIIGEYALRANLLKLKCQCGGSELQIHLAEDGKVRVTVPCIYCGKPHTYTLSKELFLYGETQVLDCPSTHMGVLFFGNKDEVDEKVELATEELNKLLEATKANSIEDFHSSEDVDEDQMVDEAAMYDIVRFLVSELQADEAIDCPCHSHQYEYDFTDDGIRIYCPICGAQYEFKADAVRATEDLLKIERLQLTLPEEK